VIPVVRNLEEWVRRWLPTRGSWLREDPPPARARGGRSTSGIASWRPPPARGSRQELSPQRDHARLRRVAPPRVSPHVVQLPLRPTRGVRGVALSPRGRPLGRVATRGARRRACPGTVDRLRGDEPHRARFAWRGHRIEIRCLPSDRLASAAARGSGTGEASGSLAFAWTAVALGSPWPSRSPHRVAPGTLCRNLVPCPRVLLMPDEPGSRRARRRRHRLDQAADCSGPRHAGPARSLLEGRPSRPPQSHPSGWPYDVSFEFPKIAPPLS
jgi:hypothetical protein